MGRRDAAQVTLEVISRMRYYLPNLVVTYETGWETRGNGTSPNYDFGNVHHTGSNTSLANPNPTRSILVNGRPDLSGPLCNETVPACTVEQPRIHVVAANPANHAGASRVSGPVPALSLYNPRTRGLEIDYAGTVAMLAGQLLVAYAWTRANADVLAGGDVEHIRAHAETSVTGKWDPGSGSGTQTINMAQFRAAAAALTPGDDDVPMDPEVLRKIDQTYRMVALLLDVEVSPKAPNEQTIGSQVAGALIGGPVEQLTGGKQGLGPIIAETFANSRTALAALTALAGKGGVAAAVASAVPAMSADTLAAIAKAVNDENDRRDRDGDPKTGKVPVSS